jgi:5-formyltetrahydrofolate cyclo-ligase
MPLSPELAQWRKAERAALISRRMAVPAAEREAWNRSIEASLRSGFGLLSDLVIGLCWPFQAEFDARPVGVEFRARGATLALPVVVAKATPLEFREWWPDAPMGVGVYDLPIPVGTPRVLPQALLIPVVGIGSVGDRLGYGGGFYDRTLASLSPPPLTIALAYELSRIPTTHPQDHDILMDFVITESGIQAAIPGGLEPVSPAEARRRAAALLAGRRGDVAGR